MIDRESPEWARGVTTLMERLGFRVQGLSELADFKLFRLEPRGGRYVEAGRIVALVTAMHFICAARHLLAL